MKINLKDIIDKSKELNKSICITYSKFEHELVYILENNIKDTFNIEKSNGYEYMHEGNIVYIQTYENFYCYSEGDHDDELSYLVYDIKDINLKSSIDNFIENLDELENLLNK